MCEIPHVFSTLSYGVESHFIVYANSSSTKQNFEAVLDFKFIVPLVTKVKFRQYEGRKETI